MKDILTQLQVALSKLVAKEVSLEADKLIDSGIAIEAESFEVGSAVFTVNEEGERIALPEGTYTTEGGLTFSTDESGVIASMEDSETPEEASEEAASEASVAAPEEAPEMSEAPVAKKVVESVSKETYFSAETEAKVIELLKEVLALMETPSEEKEEEAEKENEVMAEKATEQEPSAEANLSAEAVESEVELSTLPSEEPTAVAPKTETAPTMMSKNGSRPVNWGSMNASQRAYWTINS